MPHVLEGSQGFLQEACMLDLIGKPFKDGGRGPDSYDCWGLVREVFRRFGVELPDYNVGAFECEQIGQQIMKEMRTLARWQRLKKPEVPCVVVIKNDPVWANHCGVYIGDGKFIHTLQKIGCNIDRIDHPLWKKRIVGFFRYVG